MVAEVLRIRDTKRDGDKVTLDKLIHHAKGILLPIQEGLEIGTADSQWERSKVARLLILRSHGCVQLEGWTASIFKVHLECEATAVIPERRGDMRGHPILPVNPCIHEHLSLALAGDVVHLVNHIHGQEAGKHARLPFDVNLMSDLRGII